MRFFFSARRKGENNVFLIETDLYVALSCITLSNPGRPNSVTFVAVNYCLCPKNETILVLNQHVLIRGYVRHDTKQHNKTPPRKKLFTLSR